MSFPSPHTPSHKHTYINITIIIIIILRRDQHQNKQNTQIFKKTFEATKLYFFFLSDGLLVPERAKFTDSLGLVASYKKQIVSKMWKYKFIHKPEVKNNTRCLR